MMKRVVPAVARRLGYEIRRIGEPDDRTGIDPHEATVLKTVRPYTMTSTERVLALVQATRYVSPSAHNVNALASMLPPRHTPHSTKAPGTRLRDT